MDMDPAGLTPRRRAVVRELLLGAAAAAKGLREDVGAAVEGSVRDAEAGEASRGGGGGRIRAP